MPDRDASAAPPRGPSMWAAVLRALDRIRWPHFLAGLVLMMAAFEVLYLLRAYAVLADQGTFGGSPSYGKIARNLLESGRYSLDGTRFTAYRPPLYPLLLAGLMKLFGARWLEAAMALQALFTLATGALALRLAHVLSRQRLALLLAAALFVTDLYLQYDALCEIETPLFIVLATACLALLARPRLDTLGWLAAGVAIGLAHLTRPTGVLLLPVLLVRGLDVTPQAGPSPWRGVSLAALAFLVVVLPWQLTLRRELGITTIASSTTGGSNLYKGNNPDFLTLYPRVNLDPYEPWLQRVLREHGVDPADEVGKDRLLTTEAIEFVRDHPVAALQGAGVKLVALFSPRAMPLGTAELVDRDGRVALVGYRANDSFLMRVETAQWTVVLLGALGFALGWARRLGGDGRRLLILAATFIALCTLTQVVTISGTRFRLPLDPLMVVMAATFYAGWARRGAGAA